MDNLNEQLLASWLRLSISINNPRIVSELTYNESLICNILYNHIRLDSKEHITATDLCNSTKMLKSQMNRTLTQLEQKKLITRERSTVDKRHIYITMNIEQAKLFEKQHKQILSLIDLIVDHLGPDKAYDTIELFNTISAIADNLNLG